MKEMRSTVNLGCVHGNHLNKLETNVVSLKSGIWSTFLIESISEM